MSCLKKYLNTEANLSSKAEVDQHIAVWGAKKLVDLAAGRPFFHLNTLKNIHASEL